MELTSVKVSCKYNRKAKICTLEKVEQAKKYRHRGWTFRRIGKKLGVSESRIAIVIKGGDSPEILERRRQIAAEYYKNNREHCIQRCNENEILKRENVPGYNNRRLKRSRERYAIKVKNDTGKEVRKYKK
jgi:transcriptional regulator with XRE-family HTH domain